MDTSSNPQTVTPLDWDQRPSEPSVISGSLSGWTGAVIRRSRGIQTIAIRSPVNYDCLTMHLGSPSRISRGGKGADQDIVVRSGALTVTPSGADRLWSSNVPTDFADLHLPSAVVQQIGAEVYDVPGLNFALDARLGMIDPLIEAIFRLMLEEVEANHASSQLFLDALFHSLALQLMRLCGHVQAVPAPERISITPARLHRVLAFMEANLSNNVGVRELAEVAAISEFHFIRAFGGAVGTTPYAYLIGRRLSLAKRLLRSSELDVASTATACGFNSVRQFTRMFKQRAGTTPKQFCDRMT